RNHRKRWVGQGDAIARLRERTDRRVEHVVRATAGHDRGRVDSDVARQRLLERLRIQLRVARHRVARGLTHRALGGGRNAPEVGVVAQVDGARTPVWRVQGQLGVARPRAGTGGLRRHVRPPAPSAAAACPGSPSPRANTATSSARAAAALGDTRWYVLQRTKSSGERPEYERANPPVGSTWFAPVM